MSLPTNVKIYGLLEAILGRRRLMRFGRFLFLGARRELVNSPQINGEYRLIETVLDALSRSGAGAGTIHFDVGANLGDWTAQMFENPLAKTHSVYAFEPAPGQYAHLGQRLAARLADGRLHLEKLALADRSGTTSFLVTGDDSGNNAIATADAVVTGERIDVTLDTIDAFVAARNLGQIGFIKVDTEGNDCNVITGARETLAAGRIAILQFEYNWRWVAFGHMLHSVFNLVRDLPYQVAQVTQGGLEVHDVWHAELERFSETNFALIHNEFLPHLPHKRVRFDDANLIVTG
jgi:FkbM family methyltransferase